MPRLIWILAALLALVAPSAAASAPAGQQAGSPPAPLRVWLDDVRPSLAT